MKKLIGFCMLFVFLISAVAFAEQPAQNFTIAKNEVKNGVSFAAGSFVENNGTVNDDLFAAGQTVSNNGTVGGDLIVAGQSLSLNGLVKGDLRTAGFDIAIKGRVDKNVSAMGFNITLDENSAVAGTVSAAGSNITVKGNVGKVLQASGANVIVKGNIAGDTYLYGQNITIDPAAKIGGNLTYTSQADVKIPDGVVAGKVTKLAPPVVANPRVEQKAEKVFTVFMLWRRLLWLAASFVLGALVIKLFKGFFERVPQTIKTDWAKYLGIGFLTLITVPIASIIILVTIIGIPIGVIGFTTYLVFLYLAKFPVSVFLGSLILKEDKSIYLKLLVGLAILAVVYLLPFVGNLGAFVVILVGLGLYVYNLFFRKEGVALAE